MYGLLVRTVVDTYRVPNLHQGFELVISPSFGASIMGQPPHEIRRAAAEAFKQSLDQLQQTLESTQEPSKAHSPRREPAPQPTCDRPTNFDLAVWEEAIADIEQFIQQRQAEQQG